MLILEENSKINELSFYFKKLKIRAIKTQSKQEKEIKIKVNVHGIHSRQMIGKINETKNWFTINKIDKIFICIIKKNRQNIQITNNRNEGDITTDSRDIKKIRE